MKNRPTATADHVNAHILSNQIYENHIRALRDIYSSESAPRLKECEENNVRGKIRSVHFNRAKQFQKHEANRQIERENRIIIDRMTEVKTSNGQPKNTTAAEEYYKKMQLKNLINRKRLEYDNLNKDNLKISERIYNQKGQISFKKLESEFAKNKEHMDRIAKYKFDGEKFLLSGCLVQDEGRFRVPGSTYTTMKSIKPVLKYDPAMGQSTASLRSSRSSSRSHAGSKIQSRNMPRATSKNSIRSTSQHSVRSSHKKLRNSNLGEIFEQRVAPTFGNHNKSIQHNTSKPGSKSQPYRLKTIGQGDQTENSKKNGSALKTSVRDQGESDKHKEKKKLPKTKKERSEFNIDRSEFDDSKLKNTGQPESKKINTTGYRPKPPTKDESTPTNQGPKPFSLTGSTKEDALKYPLARKPTEGGRPVIAPVPKASNIQQFTNDNFESRNLANDKDDPATAPVRQATKTAAQADAEF